MSALKAGFFGCLGVGLAIVVVTLVLGGAASETAKVIASMTLPPRTSAPAAAAAPTASLPPRASLPVAAASPTPTPSPIVLRGTGQTATNDINLPASASIAEFTHTGRSNFAVFVFRGTDKQLLINTIGSYGGSRPLTGPSPIKLQIEADGPWTVRIAPIVCCARSGEFVGKGDAVSVQFSAPSASTWDFFHDGKSNFAVFLTCGTNRQLVQNRIGAFQGSAIQIIPPGNCYWEVQGDGNWSLKPR